MKDNHRYIMRRALGLHNGTRLTCCACEWQGRNWHVTGTTCDTWEVVQELVEIGFMRKGRDLDGGFIAFHVTCEGAQALRAMESCPRSHV